MQDVIQVAQNSAACCKKDTHVHYCLSLILLGWFYLVIRAVLWRQLLKFQPMLKLELSRGLLSLPSASWMEPKTMQDQHWLLSQM